MFDVVFGVFIYIVFNLLDLLVGIVVCFTLSGTVDNLNKLTIILDVLILNLVTIVNLGSFS